MLALRKKVAKLERWKQRCRRPVLNLRVFKGQQGYDGGRKQVGGIGLG